MLSKSNRVLWTIIAISLFVRGFLAAFLEFGNDEVYYRLYALYPDLSHFDHPPMVGYVIQLFSLNLYFDNEFFIRLSSVLFGVINTILIFSIAKLINGERAGLFAALLYNASIYCFIIAGVFILPDTPQLLFWLLSLYFMLELLPKSAFFKDDHMKMLMLGIFIGLGMISKYTSVFLWFAVGAYIIFFNRKWLRQWSFYVSTIISLIIFLPVIIWNVQNDFISFTFQGGRVSPQETAINISSFLREFFGQVFYNNPVNVVLIVISLFAIRKSAGFIEKENKRILLLSSFPLILTFLLFSLFRGTLPHWTGPAYLALIVFASAYWSEKLTQKKAVFPITMQIPAWFLVLILTLGILQIRFGILFTDTSDDITRYGKKDVTLDMYGWREAGEKFAEFFMEESKAGQKEEFIISHRWFPAANIDYYIAGPNHIKVLGLGDLESIHKYAWINNYRGGFSKGMNSYYITHSRDFKDPQIYYGDNFEKITALDTLPIKRGNKTAQYFFIYRLENLKNEVEPLIQPPH